MMTDFAIQFATDKHKGQIRKWSGVPYIIHPLRVMGLVCTYRHAHGFKYDTMEYLLNAAVLHDTLEDTDTTKEELERHFGRVVADLVAELTNNEEDIKKCGGKTTYLCEKLNKISDEALFIKLCDRLDNIRNTCADVNTYYKEAGFLEKGQDSVRATSQILNALHDDKKKRYEIIINEINKVLGETVYLLLKASHIK
jgi:(p)ppGpp synthase/HD superfamily hydrolase